MRPARPRDSTEPVHYKGLEGIRGLAALSVVVFHVGYASLFSYRDTVFAPYLEQLGGWGVDVFFVLSGFVLYRPFVVADLDGQRSGRWTNFYRRRLLRIVPAYWLALFVFVALFRAELPLHNALDAATFFGLAQIYRPYYPLQGISVAWTLCIEVSFYFVLPLLAWAIRRFALRGSRRPQPQAHLLCIAVVYLSAVIYRLVVIQWHGIGAIGLRWLPGYLDFFALGMAMAVASAWRDAGGPLPHLFRRLADVPTACWVLAFGCFWLTTRLNLTLTPSASQYATALFLNGLGAACVVLPGVFARSESLIGRFLTIRPLLFLGLVSYGIYLWHTIWLSWVYDWMAEQGLHRGFFPLLLAVLLPTLVCATLSLDLVERPAQALNGGPRRRPDWSASSRQSWDRVAVAMVAAGLLVLGFGLSR